MENNNQDPKKNQNRRSIVVCLIVALVIFLMFSFMNSQVEKASNKEITYDQFLNMLDNGQVSKVVITSDEIKITPAQQANNIYKVTYYTGVISMDYNLITRLEKANVEFSKEVTSGSSSLMYMLILCVPHDVKKLRRSYGGWKEHRKDVCPKSNGSYV